MNRLPKIRRFGLVLCALCLGAGMPIIGLAQPPDNGTKRSEDSFFADERDTTLAHWKWVFDVRLPANASAPYLALPVPTAVFDKAEVNLSDLRLVDAKGVRVPYVLRVLRAESQQTNLRNLREFDKAPGPVHRRYEMSLELDNVPASGHNEISILTTGNNFRRKVEVFGDTSDKFANPRPLLGKGKFVVHYEVEGRIIDIHRFRYDPKQFRFLQVYVYADGDEEIPTITSVQVSYDRVVPGEYVTEPATFAQGNKGDQVRADGGPGTAWMIMLPGKMPCEKLRFELAGNPSDRPFRLQVANPNEPRFDVNISDWAWRKQDEHVFLEISFPEQIASRLRFVVTDFANEPLSFTNVQVTRAIRQLILARPDPAKITPPLQLFAGNPGIGAPNYDLAQKLPADLKLMPPYAELGEVRQNPAWSPPPQTLSERMPWLVYVVLGIACLILLAILVSLARQAIHRHDKITPELRTR